VVAVSFPTPNGDASPHPSIPPSIILTQMFVVCVVVPLLIVRANLLFTVKVLNCSFILIITFIPLSFYPKKFLMLPYQGRNFDHPFELLLKLPQLQPKSPLLREY
jgi:hypothetical protein